MNISELKKQMRAGEVTFCYNKKDGTVRSARGTLSPQLIPEECKPKDATDDNTQSLDVTRYFDLDKNGWRSFRNDSLIE